MDLFEIKEEKPKIDLDEVVKNLTLAKVFALDLETTGFDQVIDRITVVSLACEVNGEVCGWAIETRDYPIELIREKLFKILHDSSKTTVFHNAPFDTKFLNMAGIYYTCQVVDTMIMLWLNDEDRIRNGGYGLKENVLKFLHHKMASFDEARSLYGDFEKYATDDSVQTLKLFRLLEEKLRKQDLLDWLWAVEAPIIRILIEMESRGVALDKAHLKKLKAEALIQIEAIEKKIFACVGYRFDVASAKQLSHILFEEKKYGMQEDGTNQFSHRGKSNEWSTNNEVLEAMRRAKIELAELLLKFREINTRLNTFIRPLIDRCVDPPYIIYPKFIQVGTVSGRFASKDPNYQNLPRDGGIRKAFIARAGYKIVRADYSQAELRLMAHMSGDPIMIDIYRNKGDIHQTTADACGVSRQAAKAINFGLIYRMSAARLQSQLAIDGIMISDAEAKDYVDKYFRKYRKVREYHQKVEKIVMSRLTENGEYGWVKTLGGRFRRLDKNYLTQRETAFSSITQAINTTIQGGVSDLIKVAMIEIQNIFKANGWLDPEKGIWDATISGQVHDELFIECKEELAEKVSKIVTYCMENAGRKYNIRVPMLADSKIVDNLAKG